MIRYNLKLKQANDNVVAVVGNTRTARNKTKSADEQDVENHIRAFPRSPFSPLRAVEESNFSFAVLGMLDISKYSMQRVEPFDRDKWRSCCGSNRPTRASMEKRTL